MKWAAQLHGVREVSLLGSADLGFWQDRLAGDELIPLNRDGRAVISIVSAAGRFAGICFRELSVSVALTPAIDSAESPSFFLDHAFNSCRFFAFCERVFFSTPYDCADVRVEHPNPTEISVTQRGHTLFRASMLRTGTSENRKPLQASEESWEARIMLPSNGPSARRQKKMFFTRISGVTQVYQFNPGADCIALHEQSNGDVFDALRKSHYIPVEWILRSQATHAKSKTYVRN